MRASSKIVEEQSAKAKGVFEFAVEKESFELFDAFLELLTYRALAGTAEPDLVFRRRSTQVKMLTATATLWFDLVVLGCMQDKELEAWRVC